MPEPLAQGDPRVRATWRQIIHRMNTVPILDCCFCLISLWPDPGAFRPLFWPAVVLGAVRAVRYVAASRCFARSRSAFCVYVSPRSRPAPPCPVSLNSNGRLYHTTIPGWIAYAWYCIEVYRYIPRYSSRAIRVCMIGMKHTVKH